MDRKPLRQPLPLELPGDEVDEDPGLGRKQAQQRAALQLLGHVDLGPRGITINTVLPGPTDTDMNPADGPLADIARQQIAVGHYGEGADTASAVAYLASPQAAFVTGAQMLGDGGFNA